MKNFTLIKRVIVLSLFSFLLVQCQKNETDKINLQEQEKDLSQIIATNEHGVTLSKKEYEEFEKEFQRENDEFNKEIKEDEIITRNYIKDGNRIDMENIPVPKPSLEVIKKREEIEKEVERILKEPLPEKMQKWGLAWNIYYKKKKGVKKESKTPTVNWWGLRNALNIYSNYCVGGDRESNNCAHYLSNSFIKVGFDDLTRNNRYINARCSGRFSSYYQRRPIRARDMRSWFNSKTTTPIKASSWTELIVKMKATKKSYFAIFQYGGGYWGGHVLIYAVNQNRFAGTGNYTDWPKQEAYSFD